MYCIAILTDQEQEGQNSAEYIRKYCAEKNVFPLIEIYQSQEQFFAETLKTVPTVLFLALPGVAGLNAAEHLRSCIRNVESSGVVTLIFLSMRSGCG